MAATVYLLEVSTVAGKYANKLVSKSAFAVQQWVAKFPELATQEEFDLVIGDMSNRRSNIGLGLGNRPSEEPWWTNAGEVNALARALVASDHFEGRSALDNLLYYYEKPYKWDAEHTRWVEAGRPDMFDFDGAEEA